MIPVLDSLIGIIMNKLVDAGIKKIVAILEVESDMEVLKGKMTDIKIILVDAKSKKIKEESINRWLAKLREVAYDVEDLLDDFAAAKLGKSESVEVTTLSIPALSRGKNNSSTSESVKDTTLCIPCWPFRGKNNSSTSESVKDITHCIPELSRDKNNSSTSKSVQDTILSFPGFSQMNKVYLKNQISIRIEIINSNLSKIYSETPTLQLLASQPNADKKVSFLITETCSNLDSEIVGIDDDATTDLVNRITRDSNRAHSLFAITGMGGIGKTTLAQKVYNHDLIRSHFDNNIVWVCVSSNRRGEDLLREIIRSFDKNYSGSGVSQNELSSKLREVVKEKRVFIVLDDIWDSHFWEKFLKAPLHKEAKHSRILITTRNQQVVEEIKYVRHTHSMKEMNPSDGLSMLCKIVFEEEDMGDMKDFADVGKKIVARCKGLPLAIKVVGGVLRKKRRRAEAWENVLTSTTWSMRDLPEDILPSLLLSYEDLPLRLKQCFTYCSLFPEDYVISRSVLENLWIAEGFFKKVEGKDVVDCQGIARDSYDELVMRNLLQVFIYPKAYRVLFPSIHDGQEFIKMHDLLRSLAVYVSQNQYIYLQSNNNSGLTRRHHLSFIRNDMKHEALSQEIREEDRVRSLRRLRVLDLQGTHIETLPDSLGALIHLRFLNVSFTKLEELSDELLRSLRRLRILDLYRTSIKTLPDSLGDLIDLRFLNVSYTEIRELPDSLGALIHLRFLNVSCTKLRKLPDSIKNLKNLETLEATWLPHLRLPMGICELFNLRCLRVGRLDNMPIGLGNLKNLRILDRFSVNDCTSSIGRQYTPNMKELKDLSELTDLSIYNIERVASKEEAEEAAIEKKTKLESLTLCWGYRDLNNVKYHLNVEEVFAGIKLPRNLRKLSIDKFFGKQLPDHMTSDRLRQLTSLELANCTSLTRLPSLGDLPKLQRLNIDGVYSVVELGSEFLGLSKFPKLQELELWGMRYLERMFDVEEGAFPCLVKLSISGCQKLNSLGEGWNHATCLETLEVKGVENLKSIENLTSIYRLSISQLRLKYVKNLPSLKRMTIWDCPALEDVNEVGKLDFLEIQDLGMKTLPRWLKSITPPKLLSVEGSEELVLRTQQSVEDQNIIKKCLYAEVRTLIGCGLKDISYSYRSNSAGSSGASSSSVTIT